MTHTSPGRGIPPPPQRAGVRAGGPADMPKAVIPAPAPAKSMGAAPKPSQFAAIQNQEDAPPCSTCGSIMVRSGACYKCSNCGTTSGCA